MKRSCRGNNFKGGGAKRNELERSGNPRSENNVQSGIRLAWSSM